MMIEEYPWHKSQWAKITAAISMKHLPHALLLKGEEGLGKFVFARLLAKTLLCQAHGARACNTCKSCHWFEQDTHPDFSMLLGRDTTIKVDDVRALLPFIQKKSHCTAGNKVVLIALAEKMNQAAANALLKALEEPTDKTYFILVSENIWALKATIKSRCQFIDFPTCYDDATLAWLEKQGHTSSVTKEALLLSDGRPLQAISLLDNKTLLEEYQLLINELHTLLVHKEPAENIMKRWQSVELGLLVKQLQFIITWFIKLQIEATDAYIHLSISEALALIIQKDICRLHAIYDELVNIRRMLTSGYNLNKILVVGKLVQIIVSTNPAGDE